SSAPNASHRPLVTTHRRLAVRVDHSNVPINPQVSAPMTRFSGENQVSAPQPSPTAISQSPGVLGLITSGDQVTARTRPAIRRSGFGQPQIRRLWIASHGMEPKGEAVS